MSKETVYVNGKELPATQHATIRVRCHDCDMEKMYIDTETHPGYEHARGERNEWVKLLSSNSTCNIIIEDLATGKVLYDKENTSSIYHTKAKVMEAMYTISLAVVLDGMWFIARKQMGA